MKNNFKIKTLYYLIFFLSLFKFESVNSEDRRYRPSIKGQYYVCANNKALPYKFLRGIIPNYYYWRWDDLQPSFSSMKLRFYSPIKYLQRIKRDWWVTSEVIIGKEPKRYSKDQKKVIVRKFMNGVDIPTSYKKTSIELTDASPLSCWENNFFYKRDCKMASEVYHFKNLENKKLSIKNGYYLFDNNGDKLSVREGFSRINFYCENDYIVLRAVQELEIKEGQAKNEFGKEIKFPIIYWIRELGLQTEPPPTMEKKFEF